MPVAQTELGGRAPICVLAVDHESTVQDRRPVAAVRAGVHPDAAARSPRNRAGELEATEARGASAMEGDGVRRPTPRDEQLARYLRLRKLPDELQRQPVEALVGDEQVRAETDHRDRQVVGPGVGERLL